MKRVLATSLIFFVSVTIMTSASPALATEEQQTTPEANDTKQFLDSSTQSHSSEPITESETATAEPATSPTASKCGKDTDCKGDRVCEDGVCVSPKLSVSPPVQQTITQANLINVRAFEKDGKAVKLEKVISYNGIPASRQNIYEYVCDLPFDTTLNRTNSYIITGSRIKYSVPFQLPEQQNVDLTVQAGSPGKLASGIILFIGGTGATATGWLLLALGTSSSTTMINDGSGHVRDVDHAPLLSKGAAWGFSIGGTIIGIPAIVYGIRLMFNNVATKVIIGKNGTSTTTQGTRTVDMCVSPTGINVAF